MSPLLKALSGTLVRALMLFAGANGMDIGDEQAETVVNGLLIAIPLIWSAYQKWSANEKIESAELQAELAERR